ncbi:hypothetical protein [Roseicyclus marinus]|uniref:hypothetical protein n=1 Tax=Roseicyclus marinus TaxID=2161673 RepID=UPI00240F748C|nr:hypothetical protein [Roseicyclus marinus]MDG3040871.1 hypothetical protein [Roseicyclus marinus]
MTYDETTEALLERILGALTRADGDDIVFLDSLSDLDRDTRALALIRALLAADASIAEVFSGSDSARELARTAALALTGRADRMEAEAPDLAPVRLSRLLEDIGRG